jgi:hypothetical protein
MLYKGLNKNMKKTIIMVNAEPVTYYTITCPYLKDDLCSIYDTRPTCCRNYPGKGRKFPFSKKVIHTCDSVCSACPTEKKCCSNIMVTIPNPTPEQVYKFLDQTICETCNKDFC